MKKYKCLLCGVEFEAEDGVEPVCPVCGATGEDLFPVESESENITKTKYSGTQTEKNLEAAFAGESQARNKYTYFASKAKKEGYEQIAALFLKLNGIIELYFLVLSRRFCLFLKIES